VLEWLPGLQLRWSVRTQGNKNHVAPHRSVVGGAKCTVPGLRLTSLPLCERAGKSDSREVCVLGREVMVVVRGQEGWWDGTGGHEALPGGSFQLPRAAALNSDTTLISECSAGPNPDNEHRHSNRNKCGLHVACDDEGWLLNLDRNWEE